MVAPCPSAPSIPQQRSSISIVCDADCTNVLIPSDAIKRSKLLQSLSDEALGETASGETVLSVPFRKQDVEAWLNFDAPRKAKSLLFSGCAATLKVLFSRFGLCSVQDCTNPALCEAVSIHQTSLSNPIMLD